MTNCEPPKVGRNMVNTKPILPDTCAWIDFFNARSTPMALAVEQALRHGRVVTCGVVKYELIQGIRDRQEQSLFLDVFRAIDCLEINDELWIAAGHLSKALRQRGKTLPLSDQLIGVVALQHDLTVLTINRHFEDIIGLSCSSG